MLGHVVLRHVGHTPRVNGREGRAEHPALSMVNRMVNMFHQVHIASLSLSPFSIYLSYSLPSSPFSPLSLSLSLSISLPMPVSLPLIITLPPSPCLISLFLSFLLSLSFSLSLSLSLALPKSPSPLPSLFFNLSQQKAHQCHDYITWQSNCMK